jgi:hypothetical protein
MQRNPSNSSGLLQRENEDLKRIVNDLEKECFQLTYYQQELQRRGGLDPFARENQDLKNKLD